MSAAVIFEGVSAGGSIVIGGNIYAKSDLEELKEYLALAVRDYEARMYAALGMPSIPTRPYKFLYSFALEDTSIFCGRGAATEELYKKVLSDRLIVLHAKSGAGKTSLLNAGLVPRFMREGRLPLYVRAYEDPVLALKRLIASAQFGPWPKLLHELALHEFLGLVCASLSRRTQELIVMLDQFEQFFLLWPQAEVRSPFIRALGGCYNDLSLPLRFVIALRKDYYSDLVEFEQVLPHLHVFQNQYRLNAMTLTEVQQAIIGPLAGLGISVTYDKALLNALLADLAHTEMELPLLQIICTRLYETRDKAEAQITLKTYEALGGAEGVLNYYLNDVLADLPSNEEALVRSVLKELVRSDGMKQILSYKALAARTEARSNELDRVLGQLENARLLRRDETAGEITYELAHEYLTREIVTWINSADQGFKQAEELLERELVNWRVQHMHIPKSRLEVLSRYRKRFKGLDTQAWECLVSSALAEDDEFAVTDWIKTAGDVAELVLFQILKASDAQIRRRVVKTLEELRTPWAVEVLIVALKDGDWHVRSEAARVLGKIGGSRAVELLIAALKDVDWHVRREAARVLGKIGGSRAVELLIAALKDEDRERWQREVDEMAASGNLAVKRLIAVLMADPLQAMEVPLRDGIVRILKSNGETAGIGFVLDTDGLIATCSHVVQSNESQKRGEPQPEKTTIVFHMTDESREAQIEQDWWRSSHKGEDVAFLRVKGDFPEGVKPLPLGSSEGTSDHPFDTFGFHKSNPKHGIWGDGHILGETEIQDIPVRQLRSNLVTPGFSGAPVVDRLRRRVVGMVTSIIHPDEYGRQAETAFITPIEILQHVCPVLKLSDVCPYRNLEAFTEADAPFFRGRERFIEMLVDNLQKEPRFLAVFGASGSGKSSVVQAGLIPRLRRGALPGSDRWDIIVTRPTDTFFKQHLGHLDQASASVALVIDQFEELFVSYDEVASLEVMTQLTHLLEHSPHVTLLIVVRNNFYSLLRQQETLAMWLEGHVVDVEPMLKPDEIESIIREPAELMGWQFEGGLIKMIVDELLAASPYYNEISTTILPLLEFALTQLWEEHQDGILTHEAYLRIGGLGGGLKQWVDDAYYTFEERLRPLVRRIFTDLVYIGDVQDHIPDSRRPRTLSMLMRSDAERTDIFQIIQRLVTDRLLVATGNYPEGAQVELIHDALLWEWRLLKGWVEENRAFMRWHQELERRVDAWVKSDRDHPTKRDPYKLFGGTDLKEAMGWLNVRASDLREDERGFIQVSRKKRHLII